LFDKKTAIAFDNICDKDFVGNCIEWSAYGRANFFTFLFAVFKKHHYLCRVKTLVPNKQV